MVPARLSIALPCLWLIGCSKDFALPDTAIDCLDEDGDYFCAGDHEGGDCDDTNPAINPNAFEIWYDGEDDDCDGNDDDKDLDGAGLATDCDDENPSIGPDAAEIWYDGIDQDCAGDDDYDADGDGVRVEGDCDDHNPNISPDAAETWYDGIDQDCAGDDDYDADGDGVQYPDDCDDQDPFEIAGDCDGGGSDGGGGVTDNDDDGYGAGTDCNDDNPFINPGAAENWYDGVDQDCDGADDYDAGGLAAEDCDDNDPTIYPGAVEVLGDGTDRDCDGDPDTASFQDLDMAGSGNLVGPRLVEFDGGVVIANLSEQLSGTSVPGSLWHFLDADAPWEGSTGTSGWSFSSGGNTFGPVYDAVGAGDYLIEGYALHSGVALNLQTTTSSLSDAAAASAALPLDYDYISDLQDLDLSYDGTDLAMVSCESLSSYEWVLYLRGTPDDFYDTPENVEVGYSVDGVGGDACAARVTDNLVEVIGDGVLLEYRYSSSTGLLTNTASTSASYTDVDFEIDATNQAYVAAGATFDVRLNGGTDSLAHPGSGTPASARVVYSGSSLYVGYVDTVGDAWLLYGTTTLGLSAVALDVGLTVDDVDLLVTSRGNLVFAARSGDLVRFMALSL